MFIYWQKYINPDLQKIVKKQKKTWQSEKNMVWCFHIENYIDGIKQTIVCHREPMGAENSVQRLFAVSFPSSISEPIVRNDGCPVIMAKDLSESEKEVASLLYAMN